MEISPEFFFSLYNHDYSSLRNQNALFSRCERENCIHSQRGVYFPPKSCSMLRFLYLKLFKWAKRTLWDKLLTLPVYHHRATSLQQVMANRSNQLISSLFSVSMRPIIEVDHPGQQVRNVKMQILRKSLKVMEKGELDRRKRTYQCL